MTFFILYQMKVGDVMVILNPDSPKIWLDLMVKEAFLSKITATWLMNLISN